MKYAFMSFSTPDLPLDETLALAARLGYDGFEPRVGCAHRHGIEYAMPDAARRDARALATRYGIAYACIATSCRFADPALSAQQRADLETAIVLAGDLGAPCVRVFGGQLPAGLARDDATAGVAAALGAAADLAARHGVTVCMETHDDWCDPAQVAAVMRAVNHPAIAVNWDIMHPVRMGFADIDESFMQLRPWIRHLHVHDGSGVEELVLQPIGQGVVNHFRALQLLQTDGYAGFISGEWINWEPAETHLPRELAILKDMEGRLKEA